MTASLVMVPGAASAEGEPLDPSTPVSTEPTPTPTPLPDPAAPGDPGSGSTPGDVVVPDPTAPGPATPRVLVFGDSISAPGRYRAQMTPQRIKAWWAHVADGARLDPTKVMVSAEAGSGIVTRGGDNRGAICTGSTFGDRLGMIGSTRPDVILVEVGRNDIWDCAGTRRVPVKPAKLERAAASYFTRLAQHADRAGVARSKVYVLTAWGSLHTDKHAAITALYEAQARSHGFRWVPIAALPKSQTLDGVHPNAQGTRTLATEALRASDLAVAISSAGERSGVVASGAVVRCQGLRACKASGTPTLDYTKAATRIWGVRGPSSRHFVAHALLSKGATAPILNATSAAAWRTDALATRSATPTAHPRAGDVAWWPSAPPGVGGGSKGHVAVVRSVSADNTATIVTEVTSGGLLRSVRYSGASKPRGFLRFTRTDGSPRGVVSATSARRGSVVVRGRAVDTDADRTGVRLRVTVRQGSRTWTRTTSRTRFDFAHRIAVPGLRSGKVAVKVTALNAPHSRGRATSLGSRRVSVR